jgi:hypothetical protein
MGGCPGRGTCGWALMDGCPAIAHKVFETAGFGDWLLQPVQAYGRPIATYI